MRSAVRLALSGALLVAGCSSQIVPRPETAEESQLFGPVSMKFDTFSKVKDWSGRGAPDGIEALVEFDDRFGDRTKAAGTVLFELFAYRSGWPDPRGTRLANPWTASLTNFDEQKAHWETASGSYLFRLAYDQMAWNRNYVLTATFQSSDGARFFAQTVLRAQAPEGREPGVSLVPQENARIPG
ncbi:MAG TPA: hypothetical protein VGG44_08910 [Tepidisphaeraceae bacterium]